MKLALTFTDNNPYPRCGIFIKHASPKVWLEEMKRMQLKLSDCKAYPCPGLEANSISGVLIILKSAQKNLSVGHHVCIQKVHANFYIPENTQLNMALTNDEYDTLLHGNPHFFHHEFGMIELTEELRWETILEQPIAKFPTIETPAKGVRIPTEVSAFSIEIEEEQETDALGNPFAEAEIDPKELPFDMKKVLKGNNAEVEKYLKYLEQNPEAALKMAIPLDMMGTSRGKAYAAYKFKSNFFESIGLGTMSEASKKFFKVVGGIIAILLIFWIGHLVIQEVQHNEDEIVSSTTTVSSDSNEQLEQENLVLESTELGDDDSLDGNTNLQPAEEVKEETSIIAVIISIIFILATILLLVYYLKSKSNHAKKSELKNKSTSWLDLPEDSELFSFDEKGKTKESGLYFGGNELSLQNKIIIFFIILGLLIYLFYPILESEGFGTFYMVLAVFIVLRLLYFLLNKNKTIIDDNE
ncbi:hypothetical protein H2O64_19655 [Kordia sp. YSTF-M3]|uniref:MoxR-vWA-beta-propeller ternary system domain-containing protein n=1 Tax=Kordia aestuariivivens TaxID=2759037 RepID=A0ABR7QEA1_9FLAO|nr:hypothetical protein [Kordia aestuariivivens]MBC8756899.1 hypothetical protein [Kordia aestuariivivens]